MGGLVLLPRRGLHRDTGWMRMMERSMPGPMMLHQVMAELCPKVMVAEHQGEEVVRSVVEVVRWAGEAVHQEVVVERKMRLLVEVRAGWSMSFRSSWRSRSSKLRSKAAHIVSDGKITLFG